MLNGRIVKKGEEDYHVLKNKTDYGSYVTYEYAYYVLNKLREYEFDKSKLPLIKEGYAEWYTDLLFFYQYIVITKQGYAVNITPKNSKNNKLNNLYFHRLEDALWERDLLLKYDWDYEVLIECADDTQNPYYSMELPPYPERKIRNITMFKDRTILFDKFYDYTHRNWWYNQETLCEAIGTSVQNMNTLLRKEYGSSLKELIKICEEGKNPNKVLMQKKKIYQPDITKHFGGT